MPPESFDAAWLDLREPVDHRSRAAGLMRPLRDAWTSCGWSRIVDLGCGTGSNLRYLSARLPGPQDWTLIDHDPALLARAAQAVCAGNVREVACVRGDLSGEGLDAIASAHLVTCAALLDLVSDAWLTRLADACERAGSAALFALSYDGTLAWSPDDPDDELVRAAVNAHQRQDKGFGPALGPSAGGRVEQLFRDRGYRTWSRPSPWHLGPPDGRLVRALVDGWEQAALEWHAQEGATGRVRTWATTRRSAVASGVFRLTVGHVDVLALPTSDVLARTAAAG